MVFTHPCQALPARPASHRHQAGCRGRIISLEQAMRRNRKCRLRHFLGCLILILRLVLPIMGKWEVIDSLTCLWQHRAEAESSWLQRGNRRERGSGHPFYAVNGDGASNCKLPWLFIQRKMVAGVTAKGAVSTARDLWWCFVIDSCFYYLNTN